MVPPDVKDATISKPVAAPLPSFPVPRRGPPALPPALVAAGVRLRAARRGDLPFLHALHRALRAPDFALAPWSQSEREAVIRDQFALQHRHLLREHPRADYWIVERRADGPGGASGSDAPIPIGRYYLDRHGRVWRAMDLGFLPGKRGFGGALVNWTKACAVAAGAHGVDLHVAHDNLRARALYLRLGFRDVDPPLDFHQRMIWLAARAGGGTGLDW